MFGRIAFGAIFLYGLVSLGILLSASYEPKEEVRDPILPPSEHLPNVSAKAWGVFEVDTGSLIYAYNATSALPIASITKLATAASVRESYDLETTTTISWRDVSTEGKAGSLEPGDILTYQQLLFPLLLESSNDAATALENAAQPDELVHDMNAYIDRAGLTDTEFVDVSGLSPSNVSTVADLSKLVSVIKKDHPHLIDITSLPSYMVDEYGWNNNSPFISDAGYSGGKHGFIPEAGRTAVVLFDETFQRGTVVTIGYAVLGSDDLMSDVRALRELVRTRGISK